MCYDLLRFSPCSGDLCEVMKYRKIWYIIPIPCLFALPFLHPHTNIHTYIHTYMYNRPHQPKTHQLEPPYHQPSTCCTIIPHTLPPLCRYVPHNPPPAYRPNGDTRPKATPRPPWARGGYIPSRFAHPGDHNNNNNNKVS